MNGVDTPTAITAGTRTSFNTLIACTESTTFPNNAAFGALAGQTVPNSSLLPASVCTTANMATANALVGAGQAYIDAGLYAGTTAPSTNGYRDIAAESMVCIQSITKV